MGPPFIESSRTAFPHFYAYRIAKTALERAKHQKDGHKDASQIATVFAAFAAEACPWTTRCLCSASPKCDHHWFYDFRVNRRRYRTTTETANKQQAKKIEAKERSRILEGGIRSASCPTSRSAFATTYLATTPSSTSAASIGTGRSSRC